MRFASASLIAVVLHLSCTSIAEPMATGTLAAPDGGPETAPPLAIPTIRFFDTSGVERAELFYTDQVTVRVEGLAPGERVELTAVMEPWRSRSTFDVASDGSIDTSRDAPANGSYEGVDVDGPFWSMDTEHFALASSTDVRFAIVRDKTTVLEATLKRPFRIEAIEVTPKGFVGKLLVPKGKGPFPAIVAFGGSEGGLSGGLAYAETLVREGYAVLALAYFGEPGLPAQLASVPLEYFDTAIDWILARSEVSGGKLGLIGGSRGGELALLLASRRKEIAAAVADAPSSYVWGAAQSEGPAWSLAGAPVPCLGAKNFGEGATYVSMPHGGSAVALTPAFTKALDDATNEERANARIPVELAEGAIAMFGGADDQLWPSCAFMENALDSLRASGHASMHADEATCFVNAGHSLGGIGLPTTWSAFATADGTNWIALGGTPKGTAHAARARARRVADFFAKNLRGAP